MLIVVVRKHLTQLVLQNREQSKRMVVPVDIHSTGKVVAQLHMHEVQPNHEGPVDRERNYLILM